MASQRSHQVLQSVWELGCTCRASSHPEGGPSASRVWLRRFFLLKLATVLLFPGGAGLPLLVAAVCSLRVLLLLRSPHISTKPSTVLLGQLALADGLLLLRWGLQLGGALARACGRDTGCAMEGSQCVWRWEAVKLLDAHQLASLLLLGLLGAEAMLVSRWPLQTRRVRTSRWAQLSCSLVWTLVLLELLLSLYFTRSQDSGPLFPYPATLQSSSSPGLVPDFSSCLRRTLWLLNLWLHYIVFSNKPQKRRNSFH